MINSDTGMARFWCEVGSCRKSYSRPDHLARHMLNHKSEQKSQCPWPGCGKTFVRSDVCRKHYKQQHETPAVEVKKVQKPRRIRFSVPKVKEDKQEKIKKEQGEEDTFVSGPQGSDGRRGSATESKPLESLEVSLSGQTLSGQTLSGQTSAPSPLNENIDTSLANEFAGQSPLTNEVLRTPSSIPHKSFSAHSSISNSIPNQSPLPNSSLSSSLPTKVLSRSSLSSQTAQTTIQKAHENGTPDSMSDLASSDEMMRWIFADIDSTDSLPHGISVSPNESLENFPELEEFEYPISQLRKDASVAPDTPSVPALEADKHAVPNFPFSTDQVVMTPQIMDSLEDIIPSIKFQEEFKRERLSYYLDCYWRYYHPQFPILNMPSFSTFKAHPILLLAMLAIGSYTSGTLSDSAASRHVIFANSIVVPLRWAIYNSKEFKPPPKLWVVQSLLLLETYEISCSSRDLHERANLHRGLSIQMLKRSPMFGGNPWSKYTKTSTSSASIPAYASTSHWEKWIAEESMKRCALATFYLETLHAVVFGHDISVDLHTVKPSLPCNEAFWRTGTYTDNCLEPPVTLLAAIKSILHRKPVKIRGFGKKIILSGLIALSFEVKYREFEFSIPELKSIKQLWQDRINEAFKFWDLNCAVTADKRPRQWSNTYSIPLRELYESYTQMRHYDFMVYAGAPGRMNVAFSEKETELVCSRVKEWANTLYGKRSIILIYSYFCNSFGDDVLYNPSHDKCFYRKQIISHMLIILWCYNFFMCGPESNAIEWNPANPDQIPCKEDAHRYLERVSNELSELTGVQFTTVNLYEDVDIFAGVLDSVTNKQNMVGLMRSLKTQYALDLSEIAREHSRLLDNCIKRSLGGSTVFCGNMFEQAST